MTDSQASEKKAPKRWRSPREIAYQRDYYAKSDKARRAREASNRHRLAKYGVGNDWVDAKVVEQGGCAVCQVKRPRGRSDWNVDHDHKTGKVRGVLCGHCNSGLGHFRDDVESLRLAIRYLETHDHRQKQLEALL